MIKNYLSDIDGVAIYPMIAFIIFFLSFCLVLLITYTRNKKEIEQAAIIPLSDESIEKISSRHED
jgi:cytochrome c oxidase cbb3-type subunit IV